MEGLIFGTLRYVILRVQCNRQSEEDRPYMEACLSSLATKAAISVFLQKVLKLFHDSAKFLTDVEIEIVRNHWKLEIAR